MLEKPKSINDYGGLIAYWDDPVIKEHHRGLGASDILQLFDLLERGELINGNRVTHASIARATGTSRSTIYHWRKRLKEGTYAS